MEKKKDRDQDQDDLPPLPDPYPIDQVEAKKREKERKRLEKSDTSGNDDDADVETKATDREDKKKKKRENVKVVTYDLRDRVPKMYFDGMVVVTFPVSLETSFEHFRLLRNQPDWKPFTARGIRDKESKEVKPMYMGSHKRPFVVKPRHVEIKSKSEAEDKEEDEQRATQEERIPLYPFTYLYFNKSNSKSKPDPVRNWSYVRWQDISPPEKAIYDSVFSQEMNHLIPKLYIGPTDGIGWHQDNGGIRKFRDLDSDTGFEDYILYPDESSYRWLQAYDPSTNTTCNLFLPSGALVTFTGEGNRKLFHCVPKDTRKDVGERITVVARKMVTEYNWDTRKVYRSTEVKKNKKKKAQGKTKSNHKRKPSEAVEEESSTKRSRVTNE